MFVEKLIFEISFVMEFLKWKHQSSSDEEGDYDVQSLISELEAASYISDKRSIAKELIVVIYPINYEIGCNKEGSIESVRHLFTYNSIYSSRIYK